MNRFEIILNKDGHSLQLLAFILLFMVSWNIERIAGIFFNHKKWKHAFLNAPFILTNVPGQLILGFAFIKVISWTGLNHFGLLYLLPSSVGLLPAFLFVFVLLDMGEYVYHIIMHKLPRFWSFHVIHHSDEVVDVTTTLREHPGENLIRLSFTLFWVFLTGCPFWMLMLRQIIQAVTTLFAHINYRLPDRADKYISFLFITPNLHQVHHHYQQPFTDCNYGDVLSIWDRIFGTFQRLPQEQLRFGVDSVMNTGVTDNFASLFKYPFKKGRGTTDTDKRNNI
ncbi:MAG: sterol desaturase family protein [Bacteroidetes bacterium]|nr:sterol desaturase family protein [Bacteroidota bacterium]